jgi:hypothetical protein
VRNYGKFALLFLLFPFASQALEIEEKEILSRPRVPYVEHIYLEQESIAAYFEITNAEAYKKLIPGIFSMPESPLCLIKINDFYKMESAPPYREAIVAILVTYKNPKTEKEMPAWHFLALAVTSEEALWGRIGGYPKVLRKVTFTSDGNVCIGTSYSRDGQSPALKLTLDLKKGKLTTDEKSFLDFISPIPALTIGGGKVLNRGAVGGGRYKIYDLERLAPQTWNIKFGVCSIEYPSDPANYLSRLGIGKQITGYWLKQKARYGIQRKEE